MLSIHFISVVEPFFEEYISETILKRLLKKEVVFDLHIISDSCKTLYESGKPADYFIMIVEGKVSVTVGTEKLGYESGSFTYFGVPCLNYKISENPNKTAINQSERELKNSTAISSNSLTFIPDYTVTAINDLLYIKVTTAQYAAARQATEYERTVKPSVRNNDKSDNKDPSSKDLPKNSPAINVSTRSLAKSVESLV